METRADVVIVSAWLRGVPLAQALRRDGLSVALIDLTHQLGTWETSDWEGPFGHFSSESPESMASLDEQFLKTYMSLAEVPAGLCLWPPKGPVQLRVDYQQELFVRKGWDTTPLTWEESDGAALKNVRLNVKQFGTPSFSQNWLGHFGFWFGATVFEDHPESWKRRGPLPLSSPFSYAAPTMKSLGQALFECTRMGIRVYSPAKLVDISTHGSSMDGVEISSERSGVVSGHRFVWSLTSEETYYCAERVGEALFPRGKIESQWCWVRYRAKWSGTDRTEALSKHLVWIGDLGLPWTHSNFFITQAVSENVVDVFVLIPSLQRIEKSYVTDLGRQIAELMQGRVPDLKVEWETWPTEIRQPLTEVGPPRHPVFAKEALGRMKTQNLGNISFSSPEQWERLAWAQQMEHGRSVQRNILAWWAKETAKRGEPGFEKSP